MPIRCGGKVADGIQPRNRLACRAGGADRVEAWITESAERMQPGPNAI